MSRVSREPAAVCGAAGGRSRIGWFSLRGAVCAFSSVHFACSVHFTFCSSPLPSHSAILFLNGTGTFPRHQKPILRDLFRPRGAVSRTPNKALEQQWKRVLPQNNFYLAPKHSV